MNHYEVLNITRLASQEQIKEAYHALAKELHPDKLDQNLSGLPKEILLNKFKEINLAYEVLVDSEKRSKYDKDLNSYNKKETTKELQEFPTEKDFIEAKVFLDCYLHESLEPAKKQIKDELISFRDIVNVRYVEFKQNNAEIDNFVVNVISGVENYYREKIQEMRKDTSQTEKMYSYIIHKNIMEFVPSSWIVKNDINFSSILILLLFLLFIAQVTFFGYGFFSMILLLIFGFISAVSFLSILECHKLKPDDSEAAVSARREVYELQLSISKIISSALGEYSSRFKTMTDKSTYYRHLLIQGQDISSFKNW